MPFLKDRGRTARWKEWVKLSERNGLRHTVYNINRDSYMGEWRNDKKHGKGTQLWQSTGDIYNGDWRQGVRCGHGTLSVPDKTGKNYVCRYVGMWKDDKRHGFGTNYYPDGCQYDGEWENGKQTGWGRMLYDDGHYEGEWLEGMRHGNGVMVYADGSEYNGEWIEDVRSGQGHYKMVNGDAYDGYWRDDNKHGPGSYYYQETGRLFKGVWVTDRPRCGSLKAVVHDAPGSPLEIPECTLVDPDRVLKESYTRYLKCAESQSKE